jgi:hypothetical protein
MDDKRTELAAVARRPGFASARMEHRPPYGTGISAQLIPSQAANPQVNLMDPLRFHDREPSQVKCLAGAASVVCPCIAVTGLVPAARDRVAETTDGAAHDDRRDHQSVSMPRRARPGRLLDARPARIRRPVAWLAAGCRGPR